jgi:hypothetical protein
VTVPDERTQAIDLVEAMLQCSTLPKGVVIPVEHRRAVATLMVDALEPRLDRLPLWTALLQGRIAELNLRLSTAGSKLYDMRQQRDRAIDLATNKENRSA